MMHLFSRQYHDVTHAPYIRSWWSNNITSALFLLALTWPFIVAFNETGGAVLPVLLISGVIALTWNIAFSRLRNQLPTMDWAVTALSFSLFVSPNLPVWQIALGMSFGVVIGEQIFGGRGLNFLNPVIVALTFLAFSFPGTQYFAYSNSFAISVLPGAILLIVSGLISWRIIVGSILAMIGVFLVAGYTDPIAPIAIMGFLTENIALGSLLFGLIFFVCDPVSSASTNPGRWLYGGLSGLLIALFALPNQSLGAPATLIFAVLLASVFAPLIDYFVIEFNARRRRHRSEKP